MKLVAQAIHDHSLRSSSLSSLSIWRPFQQRQRSHNYLPRKGAFSGAERDHKGYFKSTRAPFLDEVGETSVETQAALLRVLEIKMVQSVGAEKTSVDVRVISATDADLDQAVENGSLREPRIVYG